VLSLLAAPLFLALLAFSADAQTHPKAGPLTAQGASPSQPEETKPASEAGTAEAAQAATEGSTKSGNQKQAAPAKPASEAGTAEPAQAATEGSTESGNQEQAAPAEPATPKSSILVNIDKSTQEMTVFVDGIEQYRWPVSTGVRGYSTPSGTFEARSMNKIWYSKQWDNAPMPHAIFFTKQGHAIHGTTEEKRLGTAASHGCWSNSTAWRTPRSSWSAPRPAVRPKWRVRARPGHTRKAICHRGSSRGCLSMRSLRRSSGNGVVCSAGAGSSRKRKATMRPAIIRASLPLAIDPLRLSASLWRSN